MTETTTPRVLIIAGSESSGADILCVHDVNEMVQALKVWKTMADG